MKKLTFIFLFFISFSAFAFDYHGLKSGMTDNQIKSLTKCKYSSSCSSDDLDRFFGGEENTPPALSEMRFTYTSDNKLWRIVLSFYERRGPAGVAQLRALNELYPDLEIKREPSTYGAYRIAFLVDSDLFDKDVEKIYNETIDKY